MPRQEKPGAVAAGAAAAASRPAVLCVQLRDSGQIRHVLSALQATACECADGASAIAMARAAAMSCAIVPAQLPDMPANRLIAELHAAAPGLAVLVVADSPAISETVSYMRAGAHAVIDNRILSAGLMVYLAPLLRGR